MHKWSWGNGRRFVAPKDISTPEARVNSTQGDSNHKTPKFEGKGATKSPQNRDSQRENIAGKKKQQQQKPKPKLSWFRFVENLLQKPDAQSTTKDGNRIRDDCFTEMLYSVQQASSSEAWLAAATPCVFCDPGSLFWVSIFVASFFTCLLLSAS